VLAIIHLPVATCQRLVYQPFERHRRDGLDLPAQRQIALQSVGGGDGELVA
jgi:hypothetical protein